MKTQLEEAWLAKRAPEARSAIQWLEAEVVKTYPMQAVRRMSPWLDMVGGGNSRITIFGSIKDDHPTHECPRCPRDEPIPPPCAWMEPIWPDYDGDLPATQLSRNASDMERAHP